MSNPHLKSKILKSFARATRDFGLLILVLSFEFCVLRLVPKATIAQTYSLSIWPPLVEITIQPGKSVTQIYTITNSGDEQTLIAKVLPFEPSDSVGNINILPLPVLLSPLSFSLQNQNVLLGKPFLLKSGQSKDIVLKITVPLKNSERDYYASLIFETNPEGKIGLSQSQTAAKIAANLLITVSKTETPPKRAQILEFSTPKIIDSFDKVPFKLRIENLGQAFFKPFGEISIEGIFNQKGIIKIQPENILAQYSRTLTVPSWGQNFLLGPFQAKLEFSLEPPESNQASSGAKLSAQTTFIALPYKAILALIIILVILQTIRNLPKKIILKNDSIKAIKS